MFKQEEEVLCEWVHHHLDQGVDHFYLIDNNSTDGYRRTLEHVPPGVLTIVFDPTPHAQKTIQALHFLKKVRRAA